MKIPAFKYRATFLDEIRGRRFLLFKAMNGCISACIASPKYGPQIFIFYSNE